MTLAVLHWDNIEGLISEVAATGRYNRAECKGIKDIRQLPGYRKFDPSTAGGSKRWMQVRRLLATQFRMPTSVEEERGSLRVAYMQLKQEDYDDMRHFVSADDLHFEEYEVMR